MRILAHIHTFNDADVIGQVLDAVQRQTRRPDAIVIVDNGSTDTTLDRNFPEGAIVIRNNANLGPSGAIGVGLAHAQQHQMDWTWVLDADSVPEPDALATLLAFFDRLPPLEQERVFFLACRPVTASGVPRDCVGIFTPTGIEGAGFDVASDRTRCDCFIWTGSLFRMAAVEKVGVPSADYVADMGELEYGYRAMKLGFTSYVVTHSVLHMDVGRAPGYSSRTWRVGPLSVSLREISPFRCYYQVRNFLYFWLYQCRPYRPRWIARSIVHGLAFPRSFVIRPFTHHRQFVASVRGFWDGLTKHMERRF